MSSLYPGAQDDGTTLPDPTSLNYTNAPSHAGLHANENAAIKAIEGKLGTGASTASAGTVLAGTGAGTTSWVSASSVVTPADATTSSKGIVQLAGDLGGTAAAPTVKSIAKVYNVRDSAYGAVANTIQLTDVSMTASSSVLTSASAVFTSGDVGKVIWVRGAGTSLGTELRTTISSFTSSTSVTLATPATTTVSNAQTYYGTSDSTAIQNAVNAAGIAGGGTVYIPSGTYIMSSAINVNYDNVTIMGQGYATHIVNGLAFNFNNAHGCAHDLRYFGAGSFQASSTSDTTEFYNLTITAYFSWVFVIQTADTNANLPNGSGIHARNVNIHDNLIRRVAPQIDVETCIIQNSCENVWFERNRIYQLGGGGGINCYGFLIKKVFILNNYFELTNGSSAHSATTLNGTDMVCMGNEYYLGNAFNGIVCDAVAGEPGNQVPIDIRRINIVANTITYTGSSTGVAILMSRGQAGANGTTSNIIIEGNNILNAFEGVIVCGSDISILNNIIDLANNGDSCIKFQQNQVSPPNQDVTNIRIQGNKLLNAGGASGTKHPAIMSDPTVSTKAVNIYDLVIKDNDIRDTATVPTMSTGITLQPNGSRVVDRIDISGNYITNAAGQGIYVSGITNGMLSDNTSYNNGTVSGGAGIEINNIVKMNVIGNKAYDNRGTALQTYGIRETGTSNNNNIIANYLNGNLTSQLSLTGASTYAFGNFGSTVDAVYARLNATQTFTATNTFTAESHFGNATFTDPDSGQAYDAKFGGTNKGIAVNGVSRFNQGIDVFSSKITSLATPTVSTDAANKGYVDSAVAGLSWKAAVRAGTTTNGTLATAYANGSTIDGVTLATNDRILIKNQTSAAENGIYIVASTGAPTRSLDANSSTNFVDNTAVFIQEGTTLADTGWTLTNNGTIIPGTTALVFAQFTGTGNAGTVTSVSVTTANGVSGSVATSTTTPAITLSLGAITPSSVAASGTISGSNFSGNSSGTNTGDQTNISGNAATVTTNANLTGDITSVGNATTYNNALPVAKGGTGATANTGTGNNVLATSPILVTPLLGTPTSGVATNITGLPLTTGVTGVLPLANGGTGSATQNFVDLTTAQTVAGTKTFSSESHMASGSFTDPASGAAYDLKLGGAGLSLAVRGGTYYSANAGYGHATPKVLASQAITLGYNKMAVWEVRNPQSPAASLAAGGTLTIGTPYFFVLTALDAQSGETIQSSEVTVTPTSGNQTASITFTLPTGASSIVLYRSTTSNTYGATSKVGTFTTSPATDAGVTLTSGTPPTATTAYVNRLNAIGTSWWNGGNFGYGTTSPNSLVQIVGSFSAAITTLTTSTTLDATHYTVLVNSASATTITLPTAVGIQGRMYNIKNINTGTVTIATTASQTIDGVTTKTISVQYTTVTVQGDNSNWYVL